MRGAGCSLAAPTLAMTWPCRAQSGGRWMCSEQTSIQPDLIRHRTRMDTRAPKPRGPVLSPHPWFTGHGPENNGDVLIPRIPVPDAPGALGKVATTMGTVDADISAVPDTLVSTCDQLEGVKVLQTPCDITCNPGWIADDHPGWCDVLPSSSVQGLTDSSSSQTEHSVWRNASTLSRSPSTVTWATLFRP